MFRQFSEEKTGYEKGQTLPFLIALIAIMLILAMILLNLGQLAVFRTDVSNAADAAALAGASTLTGTLLGLGFKSDSMFGFAIGIAIVPIIIAFLGVLTAPIGIAMYIAYLIGQYSDLLQSVGEVRMGWANAKQTAISYAFNNLAIDDPRPAFKKFMNLTYPNIIPDNLPETELQRYYGYYLYGPPTPLGGMNNTTAMAIMNNSRSGFARFMEDAKTGYWYEGQFGKILPSTTVPKTITIGYGWNANGNNSYVNPGGSPHPQYPTLRDWTHYENWAEVTVKSSSTYPLAPESVLADLLNPFISRTQQWAYSKLPGFLKILGTILSFILKLMKMIFSARFPTHLTFKDGLPEDMKNATTDNLFNVTVTRSKAAKDLYLWKFDYKASATAVSHAFQQPIGQTSMSTIEQVIFDINALTDKFVAWAKREEATPDPVVTLNSTYLNKRHLFEAEITQTK